MIDCYDYIKNKGYIPYKFMINNLDYEDTRFKIPHISSEIIICEYPGLFKKYKRGKISLCTYEEMRAQYKYNEYRGT